MEETVIRIERISIKNLKNIGYGEILLTSARRSSMSGADVVGIYGQNGSGKTTVINALSILKLLMTGFPLPDEYVNYISKGESFSNLEFEFSISNGDQTECILIYNCKLGTQNNPVLPNLVEKTSKINAVKMAVIEEKIAFSGLLEGRRYISQTLAKTGDEDGIVTPPKKQSDLFGKQKKNIQDLLGVKSVTFANAQSFLFSKQVIDNILENSSNESFKYLFRSLIQYANQSLFVVDTKGTGLISLNAAIPFVFKIKDQHRMAAGTFPVSLNDRTLLPTEHYEVVRQVIKHMNSVLVQLIPNMEVGIEDYGKQLMDDGKPGQLIQLVSERNGIKLPLKSESEGIIKIISVLQLLIVLFNSKTITVAIDELDAGIFEYLLGEILKIIDDSGEGQLIFTSHNLRPLEMLNDRNIWFTTTDSKRRFTQINVQPTNNLRSVYYRDIVLGRDDVSLYDKTNNFEIALAFRMAGLQNA